MEKRARQHLLICAAMASAPFACVDQLHAQVTGLTKGQSWFLTNGIQVQALSTNTDPWHLATVQAASYTTVNWLWDSNVTLQSNLPWARWVRPPGTYNGTNYPDGELPPLNSDESGKMSSLIAMSLGDEPNLLDDATRQTYIDWFNRVESNYPQFSKTLLYVNNYGGQVPDAQLGDFITRAHPDMISFDTYPYRYAAPNNTTPVQPAGGSPTNWYGDLRRYRQWGINTNTPLGIYRQTYYSTTEGVRAPSTSEMRLNTMAGVAFNAKYLTDFTYNSGASSLFNNASGGDNSPNANYAAQTINNAMVRNIGPAMVRLKPVADTASDHTTSIMFVRGKNNPGSGAVFNSVPVGFIPDPSSQAYSDWTFGDNDPWISGGFPNGAQNQGTKNGGLPGDMIVSWFQPLHEWFDGDDWNNEKYIMVTNGLADMNGTPADCKQSLTLQFGSSSTAFPYANLQVLDPATGQISLMPVSAVTGSNNKKQFTFTLDGGSALIFKYPDGAPFVGTLPPDSTWTNSAGGVFQTGGNWDTAAAPATTSFIHFGKLGTGAGPTYTVTFNANATANGAFVHRDNVNLNLSSKRLTLTGFSGVDSLIVGMYSGESGSLTLSNGTLAVAANAGYYSEIGKASGAKGTMILNSGAVWTSAPDVLIGKLGSGTLSINAGATASLADTYVGGSTTAAGGIGVMKIAGGTVTTTGTLKVWNTTGSSINLSSGTLTVGTLDTSSNPAHFSWTGGMLAVTNPTMNIDSTGPLGASVTISGTKALSVPGTLAINSGASVTESAGTISTGTVLMTGGNFTRSGGAMAFSRFTQTGGTSSLGAISTTGSITIGGGGAATQLTASNINANTLTINALGTAQITPTSATASDVASLSIAGGATPTGSLDLGGNGMVIDYSTNSPLATIQSQITHAYAGGTWNATGIRSSLAALVAADSSNIHKSGIGYAEASALGIGTFMNQKVDSTAILIRYTLFGDANLDGRVNSDDFDLVAAHFGTHGAVWNQGDFNYDGTVNALDFNALATNYSAVVSADLPDALPEDVLVPEPAGALMLAMLGLTLRRRRGKSSGDK